MKRFFRTITKCLKNYLILSFDYGQFKSIKKNISIDAGGDPIPWYTFPAIEYLNQFDFRHCSVFEFGSGNSTLYWASRCAKLISVEDNAKWFTDLRKRLSSSVEYFFLDNEEEYANSILLFEEQFDIIIIDGSNRLKCAKNALKKIKQNGLIILDNSDWHKDISAIIRECGFIQVDFSGFGPINQYTWTTSLFISREIKLIPLNNIQPLSPIGSINP